MEENNDEWVVREVFDAPKKMNINEWNPDDRPREKMMEKGAQALANAELLAILIGSGTPKESAVDLMRRIMADCSNSLKNLGQKSIEELMSYHGIGEAKAITILAACELGRRRQEEEALIRLDLSSAESIYEYMRPKMQDLTTEEAWILLLNNNFKLVCEPVRISQGGLTETAVDVRVIVRHAILSKATVVVLLHNHPSGNCRPSGHDDKITKSVREGLSFMRLHFADHIIVTDGKYYSYVEEGKL